MQGKTTSGFEFEIDERATQTWRFLELTKKMKNSEDRLDQFAALDEALELLLGSPEEKEKLLQHVEKENEGYAMLDKVVDEFNEIVLSVKNSPSSSTAS